VRLLLFHTPAYLLTFGVLAGVNFLEKTVVLRNTEITFSIWDLGGQREFLSMLPLVCNDAVAIFFMFDLSRKSTLLSVKEWYRQARGLNRVSESCAKHTCHAYRSGWFVNSLLALHAACTSIIQTAQAFLVGTKFDLFSTLPPEEVDEIDKLARKYAKAMKAPLVFSSASHSINVQKMFKIVLSKVFDLKCTVAEIVEVGEPLLIF
jgi:GTP-binding protein of the ras superfamily involved in termination of M-phase